MMAISAVDVALWDLKARLLGVPLASLIGRFHRGVPCYASGGFTSYSVARLGEQAEHFMQAIIAGDPNSRRVIRQSFIEKVIEFLPGR